MSYTCQICGNEDEQLASWRMLSIGTFHFLICPDHKDMSLAEIAENLDLSPRAEKMDIQRETTSEVNRLRRQ